MPTLHCQSKRFFIDRGIHDSRPLVQISDKEIINDALSLKRKNSSIRLRKLPKRVHPHPATSISNNDCNSTNSSIVETSVLNPRHLKPTLQVGDSVYSAWWPSVQSRQTNRNSSWFEGTINSIKSVPNKNSKYGPSYYYDISFTDGDELKEVADIFVFPNFDYLLEDRTPKDTGWLGVKNVVDTNVKCIDKWAKMVGWYEVVIDGKCHQFSLLSDALRAYDTSIVNKKGVNTKECDLNLPEEWEFDNTTEEEEEIMEEDAPVGDNIDSYESRLAEAKRAYASLECIKPIAKSTNINEEQEIETIFPRDNNANANGGLELGINEQDLLQDDDKEDTLLSRDVTPPRKEVQCEVEQAVLSRDISQSSSSSSQGKRVSSHRGAIPKLLLERQRSGAMNNDVTGMTRRVESVEASLQPHTLNTRADIEESNSQELSIAVTNSEDEPRNITPDAVNEKQHPPFDKEAHDLALDTAESDPVEISSPDKEKSFDSRYELAWRRNIEALEQYKQIHGHTNVPSTQRPLGNFVSNARQNYRKGASVLTQERIQDLDELGFEWTRSGEHNHLSTSRTLGTSSTQVNQENIEVDWIAAALDQTPLAPLPTTNEEGKSFLQDALELGFSSNYLANKTDDEARMLIHIVTTVRRRTQEESGLNASNELFERIESALERGHSASFLVNKTEEEVQVISTQDPEKEIQSPPRKETARKSVDIMYPGNGNSNSGCQTYPYGNYCTMPSQNEEDEHDMSNGHQLVREDSGMMVTSHEQDEQPSEEHVSTDDKRVGPCTCKNTKCLKLYCVCLAAEEYCHDECSCDDCQNLPRYDAIRNEAILEIMAKNHEAFNKQSNPCKCKNSACLKKYCECFAAGGTCESSCKCIDCKNYDGSEALIAKRTNSKSTARKSKAKVARKSKAKVVYSRHYAQQYELISSSLPVVHGPLPNHPPQHYQVQQYPPDYNPYYPYGHPQMMIMPQAGEGYSTQQGWYPLPSSRIDESQSKDVERSETTDSDATVQLNKNDYGAPKVHDLFEEDDVSDEDEIDASEDESEENNYDEDINSDIDGHSSDDDHSLPDNDSRIKRPSAISWMQKRGSSTSLLNRPKQSSTQARGTDDVFNYWMAKKSTNQHLPVSNALRNQTTMTGERLPGEAVEILNAWISSPEHVNNPYPTPEEVDDLLQQTGIDRKQLHGWFGNARAKLKRLKTVSNHYLPVSQALRDQTTFDYRTNGVRQLASGNWEVSYNYHGARRSLSTYATLDQAAAQEAAGGSTERSATSSEKRDPKLTIDHKTVGVRQVLSGKWEVRIASYHKTRCYIGTFETIDQAELANKVARTVLMATKDAELTAEEIKENMIAARNAAKEAAGSTKRKHEDQPNDGPVLSEGFDMWLANRKNEWAQNRHKKWKESIHNKGSLSSDTFSDWLSSRKSIWKAIRQRKRRKIQSQQIDPPDHSMLPSPSRKTGKNLLPSEAVSILKDWMSENIDNPYPTKEDKQELMKKTGIDGKQIQNWFNNARASMKKKKKQSKHTQEAVGTSTVSTEKKRKHKDQPIDDPLHSKEDFDGWLAKRKDEWNQNRQKKWKEQVYTTMTASLSSDTFSDWLSSRKSTWEAIRQRKKRKIQSQQIDPPNHIMLPSPQRKTSKNHLPTEAVAILKVWMSEHIDNPYPTKEEGDDLLEQTGIEKKQMNNWFNNARASMKKKQSKSIEGLRYNGEVRKAAGSSTVSTKRKHGYQSKDDPVLSEERFEYNKASLSSNTFSDWLSSRKSTWAAVRQRKRRKIQTQQSKHTDAQPKKTTIDYRTVGVRQTKSNKWEVGFRYQGARRSLSTYATQDQAAIANKIGRKLLMATKDSKLTNEEIEQNVKAARAAAQSAAQG